MALFIKQVPLRGGTTPRPDKDAKAAAKAAGKAEKRGGADAVVEVAPAGAAAFPEPVSIPAVPVPQAPDSAAGAAGEVRAIALERQPVGPLLHGQVREPDGTAVDAAALTLLDADGHEVGHARTDGFGDYLLRAPAAADFVLVAGAPGFGPVATPVTAGGCSGRARAHPRPARGPAHRHRPGRRRRAGARRGRRADRPRRRAPGSETTREGGRYALAGVTAGAHTLTVVAGAHPPAAEAVEIPETGAGRCDMTLAADGAVTLPSPTRPEPSYTAS